MEMCSTVVERRDKIKISNLGLGKCLGGQNKGKTEMNGLDFGGVFFFSVMSLFRSRMLCGEHI